MPPQIIRNDQTGEVALFDTDSQQFVGKILKHDKTGAYGLWDENAKSLKPIQMPKDFAERVDISKQLSRAETRLDSDKNEMARLNGQVSTGGRVEPMVLPKGKEPESEVFGAWDRATSKVGEMASDFSQPYVGSTGSVLVGAGAKAITDYFTPGALARGAQLGAKVAAKGALHLPGGQAARMEMAIDDVNAALKSKDVGATARFTAADQAAQVGMQDRIPIPRTQSNVQSLIAELESHPTINPDNPGLKYAKLLQGRIRELKGAPTAEWLDTELSNIGKATGALKNEGEHVRKGFSNLFKSMSEDMRSTTGGTMTTPGGFLTTPGKGVTGQVATTTSTVNPTNAGVLIRERDLAYRNKAAISDVQEIFDDLVKRKHGFENLSDVNANQVLDKITKNDYLMKSFAPGDFDDIKAILTKVAALPALPPPAGVMHGAGKFLATSGGTMGPLTLAGVDPVTAGAIGATMSTFFEITRRLLPSAIGRKALRGALESGPINQNKINMLAQLAKGMPDEPSN